MLNHRRKQMLYQMELPTPVGYLRVRATNTAITEITFFDQALKANEVAPNKITELALTQLQEYLNKERQQFDLPLAPQGTDFQKSVWQQLQTLEYGETVSYQTIAKALNKPTASRAVGAANGKNPIGVVIPCHRVIGANGSLTGYAGGLDRKQFLLALESHACESNGTQTLLDL
jgi:methylated-DNA-[protein]-cysteine S-methyltransferase